MRKIFVISDTHFNHSNILNFCDADGNKFRGDLFNNVSDMNEKMIYNWNSVVNNEDIVYHCGDVYFGSATEAEKILQRLNGRKRLLLGNHDNGKDPILHKYFEKILLWRMFPEYRLLLTHVPVHDSAFHDYSKFDYNVHGHIHEKSLSDKRYINVSVEKTNYFPIDIETLIK